jgi:hypothetical protein
VGSHDGAFGVLLTGGASAKNAGCTLTEIAKANSVVIPAVFDKLGLSGITEKVGKPLTEGLLEKLREGK